MYSNIKKLFFKKEMFYFMLNSIMNFDQSQDFMCWLKLLIYREKCLKLCCLTGSLNFQEVSSRDEEKKKRIIILVLRKWSYCSKS